MIYCRKCGTALPDDAQYCIKCGAKVVPLPDPSTGPLPLHTDASANKPSSHQETPSSKKPASRPVQPRKSPASSRSSSVTEKIAYAIGGLLLLGGCFALIFCFFMPSPSATGTKASVRQTSSSSANTSSAGSTAQSEEQRKAHEEAIKPPITLNKVTVRPNVIGEPQLSLSLTNNSSKSIDAFKIRVSAYDNYGTKLKEFGYGDDYYAGISQDTIPPGSTSSSDKSWTLHGFESGRKFVVRLISLHFSDGTEWSTEKDQQITIEGRFNP